MHVHVHLHGLYHSITIIVHPPHHVSHAKRSHRQAILIFIDPLPDSEFQ